MIKKIQITKKRYVGPGEPVFVVAEIGQNHNGEMEIARRLIDVAVEAKADAVKFTKRTIEDVLIKSALEAPYQSPNSFGETYGEHRKALELDIEQHKELAEYAREKGIIYFATPTDIHAADQLEGIGVPLYKIASRDLINIPLIEHIAQKGKPVFMSTGMSTMQEIEKAVDAILKHNEDLVLFQCTSEYPAAYEHVNLRVIETFRKKFNINIGYSGHTIGIVMPVVAAALGAVAIEKHITLARYMKGTDHAASLEPEGLKRVVRDIRHLESALGDGVKHVYDSELQVKRKLGKSLIVKTSLNKGTAIRREMIGIKGPGTGISPLDIEQVIDKKLNKDKSADTILFWEDLSE